MTWSFKLCVWNHVQCGARQGHCHQSLSYFSYIHFLHTPAVMISSSPSHHFESNFFKNRPTPFSTFPSRSSIPPGLTPGPCFPGFAPCAASSSVGRYACACTPYASLWLGICCG